MQMQSKKQLKKYSRNKSLFGYDVKNVLDVNLRLNVCYLKKQSKIQLIN